MVFFERAQRRITINYAKRQQGRKLYAAQSSHLPLKINMAGVIPVIFAQSIILFPGAVAKFMSSVKGLGWLNDVSLALSYGQPAYIVVFAIAVIFFSFFYTALVFNPKETADNLKKSGAFIPGIRPGEQTANYIDKVMTRLTLVGSVYLALVALLPQFLILAWNVPFILGNLVVDCRRGHYGLHGASASSFDEPSIRVLNEKIRPERLEVWAYSISGEENESKSISKTNVSKL